MRAALSLLFAAPAAGVSYEAFAAQWGKTQTAERKAIYAANLAEIEAHNADATNSYQMGVNEYTDWTPAEFKARRTGLHKGMWAAQLAAGKKHVHSGKTPPDSVDWRTTAGVVSAVKDQKSCGSCWAFSTVETVESAVAIATNKSFVLSPQQVVDCAPNPDHCGGTGGCEGSIQPLGFKYIKETGGMVTESNYPYKGKDGTCQDSKKTKVATIEGYVSLDTNKYHDLLDAVANIGPIAISVAAEPWQSYQKGIFTCKGSGCTDIDHAVQLVGYGTDNGADYWLVRNSWGKSWGEDGFIRLHRKGTSPCKTDTKPADGFGCDGGPSSITVCGDSGVLSGSSYPTGAKLV